MASIKKDKYGKYQVRYYVDLSDGSRKQRQKAFARSSDAKRFASEVEHAIFAGEYIEPRNTKFSDWLDGWLVFHASRIQLTTLDSYKRNAQKAKNYFKQVRLESIRASDIDAFYAFLMESGLSGASVQRVHALLRRAFEDALRDHLIPNNPFDLVQRPAAEKPTFIPPSKEAISALLSALQGTPYHLPTFISITTGLRLSEVCGLRWEDVDLGGETISIRQVKAYCKEKGVIFKRPKTLRSARTLKIPSILAQALGEAKKAQLANQLRFGESYQKSSLVCVCQDGAPVSYSELSRKTPDTLEALGFPHCRFHDLRHANITFMLQQGIPIQAVSARAGHSNTSTTLNIYAHTIGDMDEQAAKKLDDFFSAGE